MKVFKLLLLVLSVFLIAGCFSNDVELQDDTNDTPPTQDVQRDEPDLPEDVDGTDPQFVERFPGSIREGYLEGAYVEYFAQASRDELLEFYQGLADDRGYVMEQDMDEEYSLYFVIDPDNAFAEDAFGFFIREEADGFIHWTLTPDTW